MKTKSQKNSGKTASNGSWEEIILQVKDDFVQVVKRYKISVWVQLTECQQAQSFSFSRISLNKYVFAKHPEHDEPLEFTETSSHHRSNSKDPF